MTDQTLRQLLLESDAAAPLPPTTTRDLAACVRNRLRLRRTAQFTSASILLAAALAVLPLLRTTKTPSLTVNTSRPQAELSLIRLQANSQAATVNRLITYQRTLSVRATAAKKEEIGLPLDRLQRSRENAARLLTQDGNYRRVLELFPDTTYASIARHRLQT